MTPLQRRQYFPPPKKQITAAIAAKHAQIKTLQSDIDALRLAATVLSGEPTAKA